MSEPTKTGKVKVIPRDRTPKRPATFGDAKTLASLAEPGRYRDAAGNDAVRGLYLQVSNERNRSWILRYFVGKTERQLGLGSYPPFSLTEARKKANKAKQQVANGEDPILLKREAKVALAAKIAAPKALTFAQAAERYWQENRDRWRNEAEKRYALAILESYAFPKIGTVPVADISVEHVKAVIAPLWNAESVITGNRVRARMEATLAWAIVHGYRKDGDNPARWQGLLNKVLPAPRKLRPVEHHAALDWKLAADFMDALRAVEGVSARALEFLILTGARSKETAGAVWDEIDLENREWRVPSGRMKMTHFHIVTLSDAAVDLLKRLPREADNPSVFIGRGKGGAIAPTAMDDVLKKRLHGDPETSPWRDEEGRPASVHGFRSTVTDWGEDWAHFPSHVCQHAIAHAVGSASDRSYRRGTSYDERRKLMDLWADYCAGDYRNVLSFERAKA
jgi:integrase